MLAGYLMFFWTLTALGQATPKIQVIPEPKTMEDFEHQFKGCPENSECDQVMGLQLKRWKDLVSKLRDEGVDPSKRSQFVELFRSKYGIPTEFYTTKKSQQGFKPFYFNSPCKEHNPKQEDQKILKGTAFLKSLSKTKAIVWRDQAQIEVPVENLLIAQPVVVYGKETSGPVIYQLALGDQPLFIKDKSLFVIKEEDGFFYTLKVSENGDWKVENLDFTKLSEWEDKRSEVKCPLDSKKLAHPAFTVEFCKTVWDEDLKKPLIVKMFQGCTI